MYLNYQSDRKKLRFEAKKDEMCRVELYFVFKVIAGGIVTVGVASNSPLLIKSTEPTIEWVGSGVFLQ